MNYHQCSIMMVQLQGHIIADIQVHCNIILMYVYNIYLGISSPPQFPDACNQSISSIQNTHHVPSFSLHLCEYLNSILPQGDSIPRSQLANAQLPFDRLDVWHTCKFSLDVLGNDVDGEEGVDAVKAKPGRVEEAWFDTVLVAHQDLAETTGLQDV